MGREEDAVRKICIERGINPNDPAIQEIIRTFGSEMAKATEAVTRASTEMGISLSDAVRNLSSLMERAWKPKPSIKIGELSIGEVVGVTAVTIVDGGELSEPEPVFVSIEQSTFDAEIMIVDIESDPRLQSTTAELFYEELLGVFAFKTSPDPMSIQKNRVMFSFVVGPFDALNLDFIREYIEARVREMLGLVYDSEIINDELPLLRAYKSEDDAEDAIGNEHPTFIGIDFASEPDKTAITLITVDEAKAWKTFAEEYKTWEMEKDPRLEKNPCGEIPLGPSEEVSPASGAMFWPEEEDKGIPVVGSDGKTHTVFDPFGAKEETRSRGPLFHPFGPSTETLLDEGTKRARKDAEDAAAAAAAPRPWTGPGRHDNPHRTPARGKREAPMAVGESFNGATIISWVQPDVRDAHGRTHHHDLVTIRNDETGYCALCHMKDRDWVITILHGPLAAKTETISGRFNRRGVYPIIRKAISMTEEK